MRVCEIDDSGACIEVCVHLALRYSPRKVTPSSVIVL